MKRFLLLTGLLLLIGFNSKSQVFQGGILMGITASQVDGDSYAGYDKMGFLGGVFIRAQLSQLFDAQLEIRYASRGARNPASDDNTGSYLLALHYIDLPVMAALKIKNYGAIEVGLVPGYMFAAKGEKDAVKIPDEYLVDFHKFDLGTLIGANIRITEKASVNIRYSYSIFSIHDSAGAYYSWFGKIFGHSQGDYNNYLTLAILYKIR